MSKRIEGLFLKSTKIKHNSLIVDLLTNEYGRCSFIFHVSKKKLFAFQPFHFIEFSSNYNSEKKLNRASEAEIIFPVLNIISDVRKTGYALLLTEILNKLIHKQEKNPLLYMEIKKMVQVFEKRPFNPVFGVFFLKEMLNFIGIQPHNNFTLNSPYFDIEEGRFTNEKTNNMLVDFPDKLFSDLLGTKIDTIFSYKLKNIHRRKIMELLLNYIQFHGLMNVEKIRSIQILQSLYD